MPAGQQIAFEPALARVLAEHLHHAAVGREMVVVRARSRRPRRGSSPRTRPASGWSRSRPGRTGGSCALSRFSFITSRRNSPSTRVASASPRRATRPRPRSRGSRACPDRAAASRHWRADWRSCGASPVGASAASSGLQRAVVVEQLLGPVAPHPLFEHAHVLGILVHLGDRHLVGAPVPSSACRRPPSGRSSPSACAARSSARRAAW